MATSASPITVSAVHEAHRDRERLLALLRFEREQGFAEFAQEFIDGARDIVLDMEDVADLEAVSDERALLQARMEDAVCEAMLLALAEVGMGAAVGKLLDRFAVERRECAARSGMDSDVPFIGDESSVLAAGSEAA